MKAARSILVRGTVQGVGFRPFVYRLAAENTLSGWVRNKPDGVAIHLEGDASKIDQFLLALQDCPPAASITGMDVDSAEPAGFREFTIRQSTETTAATVRISPDLPACAKCLTEMRDPSNTRFRYPYINCTECGPRYSVIQALPYDRERTTMRTWPMDTKCQQEYDDVHDRRFHAQPLACANCGPGFVLEAETTVIAQNWRAIVGAAKRLASGAIVAIKGIGGYHLTCDARNPHVVQRLREAKYRKEQPFALMARDIETVRQIAHVAPGEEALLNSVASPIVLLRKAADLVGVAPDTNAFGVMLPYAPLHHLLFDAGAPSLLVMTSGNRSSEPIAFEDGDARTRLAGIADALLIGERPIARRVDDSIARISPNGPMILRRARGYAPGAVTTFPSKQPILALGGDLKNAITIVIDGQAFVSQHVGDLSNYESRMAFEQTIKDLTSMYGVDLSHATIAHDSHPAYFSASYALELPASRSIAVQHHRAHIASVLAEKQAWTERVLGISFDGTGWGDDGTIWGGEFFLGSLIEGFRRVQHLRPALLPGGDSAIRQPVQAAAGFLSQLHDPPNLADEPFYFGDRYFQARELVSKNVQTFETTSIGRLFDVAAALLGFTREMTFEGQAAIWLEFLAEHSTSEDAYAFPIVPSGLDFRPLLTSVIDDRGRGRPAEDIALAFHRGVARGTAQAAVELCESCGVSTVVLSGGVFQNQVLLRELHSALNAHGLRVWTNSAVPPNDGGLSLGQAAIAAFSRGPYA